MRGDSYVGRDNISVKSHSIHPVSSDLYKDLARYELLTAPQPRPVSTNHRFPYCQASSSEEPDELLTDKAPRVKKQMVSLSSSLLQAGGQ